MIEQLPLRRAVAADAAAVLALTRMAYSRWVSLIGREPKPMAADYQRAIAEHMIDVWEERGELLGLIEMIPEVDFLLVENIAVRPDRQGSGAGRKLLHHAEEVALALGLADVRLYTNAAFESNLRFYTRRGYHEFQRLTVAPGSVAVHMKKRIK
jgi:GNAT superfamily N-acetyltransferase